jgi:hypothetical protein
MADEFPNSTVLGVEYEFYFFLFALLRVNLNSKYAVNSLAPTQPFDVPQNCS